MSIGSEGLRETFRIVFALDRNRIKDLKFDVEKDAPATTQTPRYLYTWAELSLFPYIKNAGQYAREPKDIMIDLVGSYMITTQWDTL